MYLHDDTDTPIRLRGYCAVWNAPSTLQVGGIYEFISSHAFDEVVGSGIRVKAVAYHDDRLGLGDAAVWTNPIGLAFETSAILANRTNAGIVRSILSGEIRGASWRGRHETPSIEVINGSAAKVIQRIFNLEHIGPAIPVYPGTGVWLSSEDTDDLSPRLQVLGRHWSLNRPPARLRKSA